MNRLRKALVAVASVAMVAGTMGLGAAAASAASSTTSCVSRAQFIYQFDVAAGIQPVYPATATFSDVSSSSPYYGYVEAAYQAGIINGTGNGMFSPNACLTRDQVVKIEIIALGDQSAALKDATQATSFTDDSSIPSWARGYIVEAVSLGLVKGYPNGSFQPGLELSSSIAGDFISQYQSSGKSAAFAVSASTTDAAPGAAVTLSTTGAVGVVTYSTTSGAVISGSTFVGSTPGTYTVTAASTTGQSATVKIGVYGAATGLVVNVPSKVVANGASSETVTVDVVDANGNIVGNNSDQITLSNYSNVLSFTAPNTNVVDAVNGVATFSATAGTIAGATESILATDSSMVSNPFTATASLTTAAQVATSLSVSAPKYVDANSATTGSVSVEVDDQTGNPMISGNYGVSLSLSGPATFTDGTTGPEAGAYVSANTTNPDASFTFTSIQSETGAITFTASATGLTGGTGTTTSVIAGAPTAIVATVDPGSSSTFTDGTVTTSGDNTELDLSLVDSHGYPAGAMTGQVTVSVSPVGNAAGTLGASSSATGAYAPVNTSGAVDVTPNASGQIFIGDTTVGTADAGQYTVTISDNSGNGYSAAAPITLTEAAGSATQVAVSTSSIHLAATSPMTTVSAQLEDANGNAVAESGVTVTFTGAETGGTYGYTLGGVASSSTGSATYKATTDANGAATAVFSAGPYTGGVTYTVAVSSGTLTGNSEDIAVNSTIASSVSVTTFNQSTGTQTSLFTAGDTILVKASVTDQYGTPMTTDKVTASYGSLGPITLSYTGADSAYEGTFVTSTAGSGTIKVTDSSVASTPSGSAVVVVNPAQLAGFDLIDSSGNDATMNGGETWAANTAVTFKVTPVDQFGNATVTGTVYTVNLMNPTGDTTGAFRTNLSAGNITQLTIPAGSAGVSVYYIDSVANSTGATFPPSDWVSYTTLSTTTSGTLTFNGSSSSGTWSVTLGGGSFTSTGGTSATFTAPAAAGTSTITYTVTGDPMITLTVSY